MRWLRGQRRRRVLVIGLDCAAPALVFKRFRADLPTLSRLMTAGTWGELESSIPCITVPAWASMTTSRDPGVLGCYGFRNRPDRSYGEMVTVDSRAIAEPRLWDVLGAAGRESVVVNVPQTYPVRPLHGQLVSGFLTPGVTSAFTYPAVLRQEILRVAPDYAFDVRGFRTDDKAWLLQSLIDLTEQQYRVVRHLLTTKSWDFFMHVNIALDRLHHGFWRYFDPAHRLHESGSPFQHAIRDYYRLLDTSIADLIAAAGDDVTVLIVSDHGAKRMDGGFCLNEWLWREGWLALHDPPPAGQLTRLEDCAVDWTRTRAWGAGGYYGRIFLNVAGREPGGMIAPTDYESTRLELAAALAAIPDANGLPLRTTVYQPEAIYQQVTGVAPDLLVYFGDLHWRSVGSLGHDGIHITSNDTGPDDANHAQNGLFILYEPGRSGAGQVTGHTLLDVAPTVLQRMNVPVPAAMQGRVIGG